RVICPKCSSRIRVRRSTPSPDDVAEREPEFLRFHCPCGRRLKVRNTVPRPQAGKCPSCGQVVPVPETLSSSASGALKAVSINTETPTRELSTSQAAALDAWVAGFRPRGVEPLEPEQAPAIPDKAAAGPSPAPTRVEAGLRVCPRCGRPVHLGSESCRQCGAVVPRR
ncbi:MAG: hypothetical protein AB7I30_23565, partial [Isosphaeraceae bacterium]